jgi:uncharacterized FAD-dependent dehydrogenase
METFHTAIIGSGVAGTFAALKLTKENKGSKIILFDQGRPQGKRRRSGEGFLGYFPTSDGKLYLSDIEKISNIVGLAKTNKALKYFYSYVSNIFDCNVIKDPGLKTNMEKRVRKNGFNIIKNNYIQVIPKEIHTLSKKIAADLDKRITMCFDDEVETITKIKNLFIIKSSYKEIAAKKVIICSGRSGWRWTKNLFESFNIIENNNIAKFGIRVEASNSVMKDFHKSSCSLIKDGLELGPMSWNGTIIPEDHVDLAISSFRSNEARWKSDKMSFDLIGHREFSGDGFNEMSRIGQLTFVWLNDRVVKEKISTIISGKSKISIIPEYNWLSETLKEINNFIPDLINKGYYHAPTILPIVPKINISNKLETDIENMYVGGEASGVSGLLAAALMGIIAADSISKGR